MVSAPDYIRRNARRGVEFYEEGFAGDGLRPATVRAARRMAAGTVPHEKLRLMAPWFARHRPDLESPSARAFLAGDSPRPTAGQVWPGRSGEARLLATLWPPPDGPSEKPKS